MTKFPETEWVAFSEIGVRFPVMKSQLQLGVALVAALSVMDASGQDRPLVFPEAEGKNLHGETLRFPGAFGKAGFNVAIVAFEQEQQGLVDTWLPKLESVARKREGFAYYEFPTIEPLNRVTRWIIYKGMRSGIKDPGARSRTVTFHLEKKGFKRALRINSESDIHVFLVDREGRIIWRESGAWSEKKWRDLQSRMMETRRRESRKE